MNEDKIAAALESVAGAINSLVVAVYAFPVQWHAAKNLTADELHEAQEGLVEIFGRTKR